MNLFISFNLAYLTNNAGGTGSLTSSAAYGTQAVRIKENHLINIDLILV